LRLHFLIVLLGGTALGAVPTAAFAQAAPPTSGTAPADPGDGAGDDGLEPQAGDIVVTGTRVRGQVEAPQPAIETLEEEDIESYGASSISDLLDELAPQTGSGRGRGGRPVILLNGQRISNFREMRNIPPEAIRRMQILPEEVALRYGYPADQRVVNVILKDKFAATTAEVEFDQPDRGGSTTTEAEASLFRVQGQGRLNLTANASDTTPLFESERGVVQAQGSAPPGGIDPGSARTLIADSRSLGLNGTWTTGLGEGGLNGALTLNGAYTRGDSTSFSGLDFVTRDPLRRRTSSDTFESGLTFAKPLGEWQLTATFDGSHALSVTQIDRRSAADASPGAGDSGFDTARATTDSVNSLVTVVGRPLSLPAGDVTATIKAGYAWNGIVSSDTRNIADGADPGRTRLTRGDASAGVNLGIPLTSRRQDVLAGVGDLTLNLSAGVNRLSDFGTLTDWSAGLTWGITPRLNFQASYIQNQAAPGLTDLGNPIVQSFNVPVFDFTRGETRLVTIISGGNPDLVRETRRDVKLGVNWQLPFLSNATLVAEYFRNNSDNVTESFPVLTPEIEAAFPGRVTRDPVTGELVSIDRRPVTFANEKSSRLRYGVNVRGRLGKASAERAGRGDGAEGGPPMMGMGRGGRGGGQGRWNLALYHSVQFENLVTVADGGPVLNLLEGDALSGGGTARHSLEFEGGGFYKGFGLRMRGTWTAPTRVTGGTSDLRFGALTKVNLRAFVDLGQQKALTDASGFFRNARLSFKVDNLFDSRQRVTDATGTVPLSYQPDLLDPQGRVIGLEFRKQF